MGQESSPKVALWALPLRGAGFRCRVGGLVHCPLPPAQASLSSLECRHHVGFIFVPFISPSQIELPGPSKTLRKISTLRSPDADWRQRWGWGKRLEEEL